MFGSNMSVEHPSRVESSAAADEKVSAPVEDTTMIRSVGEEDDDDDSKRKSSEQETTANGSESQTMKETTAASPARDWFENLSTTERASALGFVDGPFLETLLSFASWSPVAETRMEGASTGNVIDWSTMVRIKDFETQLLAERQKTPLLKKSTDGSNDVVGEDLQDGETASFGKNDAGGSGESKKSPEDPVDSNAFRIRSDDEKSSEQPAVQSLLQSQDPKKETHKEDPIVCSYVFDRLSVTFPSAFRHATGMLVDERFPFVTLHPSCFESIDDKQLFHDLDAFSLSVFQRKFLARDAANSLDVFGCQQSKKNQDDSLPLSAFVLARLDSSVLESFKETKSQLSTQGLVDGNAKRPSAIFGDLVSYARAVDDMAMTMDSAALQDFTSPFLSSLGVSIPQSLLKLESLSLTPLRWLVIEGDHRVDLIALDKQVQASLHRMADHGSSVSSPAPLKDGTEEVHKVPNRKETQSKKNKKRKANKRRRRKTSNADKVGASSKNALLKTESSTEKDAIESDDTSWPCLGDENEQKTPAVEKKASTENIIDEVTEVTDEEVTPNEHVEVAASKDLESVTSVDSSHEGEKSEVAATTSAPPSGDITISRVEGVIRVSAPVAEQLNPSVANATPSDTKATGEAKEEDDGHAWETVAQKARGSRKKGSNHSGSRHGTNGGGNDSHGASSRKSKGKRTSDSRKKARNTKIARDVISSILNKVDEEVKRKKPVAAQPAVNPWKVGQKASSSPDRTVNGDDEAKKEFKVASGKTMRDLVVEVKGSAAAKKMPVSAAAAAAIVAAPNQNRFIPVDPRSPTRRDHVARSKASPTQRLKGGVAITADQSTAPTYQETVSAVSSPSNAAVESKEGRNSVEERVSKSDSSNESVEETPQNQGRIPLTPSKKRSSRDPPLPTLLSPENANSASSSVASSLEVPHGGNRHHHSNCSVDTSDVGCHLLDVCDRLSKEMALFMSRRNLALTARRRERGALLAALQDTVSAIWPSGGHVELYGSCATQLDLPSSDLDVVVIGLDRALNAAGQSQVESADADTAADTKTSKSKDISLSPEDPKQSTAQQSLTLPLGLSLHRNAERVVRLAAALEAQPWAVQVNAIPTASVPVVKILADPSRLTGTAHGGDWSAPREEMVTQTPNGTGNAAPRQLDEDEVARQQFNHQPWRGSDVMNGLLSLDITFEGSEHGGLGSTEFSARTVAEACREFGHEPDATPFVQALMVLKELLAQRKLNEPYSGGLSSYALLLLVVALIRERAAIREELERVEQQRQAMAAIDNRASFSGATASVKNEDTSPVPASSVAKATRLEHSGKPKGRKKATAPQKSSKKGPEKNQKTAPPASPKAKKSTVVTPAVSPKPKASSVSSWASIARKPSTLSIGSVSQESSGKQSEEGMPKPAVTNTKPSLLTKKPSFADAVARSTVSAPKAAAQDAKKATQNKPSSQNTFAHKSPSQESKKAPQKKPTSTVKTAPQDLPKEKGYSARPTRSDSIAQQSSDTPQMRNSDGPSVGPASVAPVAAPVDPQLMPVLPFYAQGFNDIVEVLCSGETTAGKLLMHFLLYYGEQFDAHTTSIDISGKHDRGYMNQMLSPYPYLSPYIPRMSHGHIDPVTGMLTVDPIVIYDPLEGAENNNVARRCFAWNSVRWIFAQSYATLSSAVERSATPPASHAGAKHASAVAWDGRLQLNSSGSSAQIDDVADDLMDPSSSLLRCLLSF